MITDREKIIAIVDNDCLGKSDVAVLLEGDGYFRVLKAVELYKKGIVDRIVFSGNATDIGYGSFPYSEIKPYILQEGVPEDILIHEDKSMNTREQAINVINMAIHNGWKKLALIASHEHQYRAYLTFLRVVLDSKSNIVLFNAPARNLNWFTDSGWGTRMDRLTEEFLRIEAYSAKGHLATAQEVIDYQKWKEGLFSD